MRSQDCRLRRLTRSERPKKNIKLHAFPLFLVITELEGNVRSMGHYLRAICSRTATLFTRLSRNRNYSKCVALQGGIMVAICWLRK